MKLLRGGRGPAAIAVLVPVAVLGVVDGPAARSSPVTARSRPSSSCMAPGPTHPVGAGRSTVCSATGMWYGPSPTRYAA
jgi:hypothetical protein